MATCRAPPRCPLSDGAVFAAGDGRVVKVARCDGDAGAHGEAHTLALLVGRLPRGALCPVPRALGAGVCGAGHALVSEHGGVTLSEALQQDALRGRAVVHDILRQLFARVAQLHAAGIAHRDLKPSNILVRLAGSVGAPPAHAGPAVVVRLCDLGTAIDTHSVWFAAPYCGARVYRPPEALLGAARCGRAADHRAGDMWALGVIAMEVLSGRPPFLGHDEADHLLQLFSALGLPSDAALAAMGVPGAHAAGPCEEARAPAYTRISNS